jgi:hypothetical protein
MRYVFHPEALAEYAEAAQYYYSEQRAEVAQGFINAVEDFIEFGNLLIARLQLMIISDDA